MSVGSNVETCTVEVVRLPGDIEKWHFVNAFLQLRTDIFVDKMSWNLHVHEGLEFEQIGNYPFGTNLDRPTPKITAMGYHNAKTNS